jgi:hypothetical protein
MRSKLFLSGFLATAAVTGTVLFAANSHAFPCSYGNKFGTTDSNSAPTTSGSAGNQVNFEQPDLKKFGIATTGLAALLGLSGGALFLKSRFSKRGDQPEQATLAEAETESYVEYPTFPIQVPSGALTAARDAEDTAQIESSNSSIR